MAARANGTGERGAVNRYLTDLAVRWRKWEIPVGLMSALLAYISVEVWIEDPVGYEGFTVWLLAHLCVVILMLSPLFFIARWHVRQRRARRVAAKLAKCERAFIPLDELDRALGMKNARSKVRRLKRQGFLQRLELTGDALVLDNAWPEPSHEEEAQPATDDIISEIRRLNDEIDDDAVSARIERIEHATASILRAVGERPDMGDDARRFMSYYLPTTLKLLESYRLMEKQSYQGQTIQAARRRIEAVLDKLADAAEQQQDKLFRSEALDVETEINVLETMMTSDGLVETKKTAKS